MDEIELIVRIMIANAYYYGSTHVIKFDDSSIMETVPKLSAHFAKYGYNTDVFSRIDDEDMYSNYKKLMLSIFGDIIYEDGRKFDSSWFGLYDEEMEYLEIVHLSHTDAGKWCDLAANYDQYFIEHGSYIITEDMEAYTEQRDRLSRNAKELVYADKRDNTLGN